MRSNNIKASRGWAALAVATLLCAVSPDVSATCWNNGCFGKDPVATGCSTGSFVARSAAIKSSSGSIVGHVQLVYSPTCGAAWAYVGSAVGSVSAIKAEVQTYNPSTTGGGVADHGCSDCKATRTSMMGDAGTTYAWAIGWMKFHLLDIYLTFKAKTGQF